MIIKKDPAVVASYFEDSSNLKGGYAEEVAFPKDIEELSALLRQADQKNTPVTISGGGTGTTGARIPFGGMAVSMEKFDNMLTVSDARRSAAAEAGIRVEDFKNACEKMGLFYTSHPTEKASFLGGTIATNASGSRSFRYGSTRRYVKRLKMVLPSGEVLEVKRGGHILTRNNSKIKLPGGSLIDIPLPAYKMPDIKSSAGYYAKDGMDLIDLFIGQEGTLSVIVEAELELAKMPNSVFSCFVFFEKEEDAWRFSRDVKAMPGSSVLSIEYFDSNALELLKLKNPNVPSGVNAAIFFEDESGTRQNTDPIDKWMSLISRHNASPENTWVAMNEKEAADFTLFRYAIPEAVNEIIKKSGFRKISTDIAVPDNGFLDMAAFYVNALKREGLRHVIFGHIGENHLHVNILPRSLSELAKAKEAALRFVKKGTSLGGTVSAEHGIGKIKHEYLEEMYGHRAILEMARIKKAFDPNWILGRDNIFPVEVSKELV